MTRSRRRSAQASGCPVPSARRWPRRCPGVSAPGSAFHPMQSHVQQQRYHPALRSSLLVGQTDYSRSPRLSTTAGSVSGRKSPSSASSRHDRFVERRRQVRVQQPFPLTVLLAQRGIDRRDRIVAAAARQTHRISVRTALPIPFQACRPAPDAPVSDHWNTERAVCRCSSDIHTSHRQRSHAGGDAPASPAPPCPQRSGDPSVDTRRGAPRCFVTCRTLNSAFDRSATSISADCDPFQVPRLRCLEDPLP